MQKAAVLKALELDDSLAEAHSALAGLETWGEWDWPSAESAAARSLRTDTRASYVAQLYARAGDNDRALEWLERAFADRNPNMPYLLLPTYDSVREDPRFQDLMRRMNLPP